MLFLLQFNQFGHLSRDQSSRWGSLAAAMKIDAAATSARTRRSLPPGGMLALQESMREKQMRAKEAREIRQRIIGVEQRHIMSLVVNPSYISYTRFCICVAHTNASVINVLLTQVARCLEIDVDQVEEQILDTPEQIEIFSAWLGKDRAVRTLSFCYQEAEYLPLEDCGRVMNGQKGQPVS